MNKVCLITGGTSGIGLGIAKRFAQEGAKVISCSIDKDIPNALDSIREGGKYDIEGLHCDVTKSDERKDILRHIETKYGKLNVLALNAGIGGHIGR